MLMNNLDPDVAERPGRSGRVRRHRARAARSWPAFDAIVALARDRSSTTRRCSCSRASRSAVFRTHPWAPRVLIANSLLVPAWANWKTFRDLEDRGLTMYGQMTAGSWIYIGTQGILQGTYETLAAVARRHFGGTLRGTLTVTAGLGGMGGAQPLAVTMNEGVALVVEVDPARIERRLATRYLDEAADVARRRARRARRTTAARGVARSIGLEANAADVLPALVARGVTPDVLTDQTSAHDALHRLRPERPVARRGGRACASVDPDEYIRRSMAAMADARRAMLALQARGAVTFDYGNNLRAQARAGRRRERVRHSRLRARVRAAALLRRQGPVPLGRALGRSGGHPRDRSARARDVRATTRRSAAGFGWRASASRSRDCRRGSSGSATASARGSASR